MRPFDQSSRMVLLVQMVLKRSVRAVAVVLMSAFNISAWMESMPDTLPLFMALIAVLTSAPVDGQVLITRTLSAGGGLADSSGSAGG